jgi:hypothetical protein
MWSEQLSLLLLHLSELLPLRLRCVDRMLSDLALLLEFPLMVTRLTVEVDNVGHQAEPPSFAKSSEADCTSGPTVAVIG